MVLKLLLELVVLDSESFSWNVELVFVDRSVCIRLVGKCGFESICPHLQYIQGKSILVFQYVPIYILLVCECVVGHTCSGCLCKLRSCHTVLVFVEVVKLVPLECDLAVLAS